MMDMRRPGAPPKKKKKKNKMSARGGGSGGKRGGDGPPKRSICKFYLDSKCNKGADCPFSHDAPQARKADLCKFYLGGYCARGEHCSFMHQDFPCKFFHTGAKCYADASCRFSHQPLTDETRRLLNRYLDNCGGRMEDDMMPPGGGGGPDCMDFPPDRRPGGPDDDRGGVGGGPQPGEDFGGPPPCAKRPSLLGSPPRHVKEAAETWRMQFLGGGSGGAPPMRGPAPPFGGGGPQGLPMMSPPRGFPSRPSFYMDAMSMSPVRGPMGPQGASPPHMVSGGPCLDEGFGGPMGGGPMHPMPHGRPGGFGSPGISSPPLQDQGPCGPGGLVPNPGMSPLGVFYDTSQDQPMSPPSQQQQQQQCIPGLNLAGPLSPPHSQAASSPAQIPSTDTSSDQPLRSPPHRSPPPPQATHHDDQDCGGSGDDSHSSLNEKKVLPPNLPRRQRELFMRIQQQQRTAEMTAAEEAADGAANNGANPATTVADQTESPAAAKPEPAKIASLLANDESSSDDDENYNPLPAVLKKLQQEPVDSRNSSTTSVAASSASAVVTPSPAQPSPLAMPSMVGLDIARMLNNLRQVPSEPQTNFWKQLFSGVSAATAAVAATSAADTTPAPCPPPAPAVSRDPRRARAEAQLAKQADQPPTSRDPRLRDKPPPAPKVVETAFVESKDGDVPYKLTSILRALPKYDDVVRGGAIPESKLKSDPRLAKYVGQKLAEPVAAATVVPATPPVEVALKLAAALPLPTALPLPAVSALLKPPTVNRRDPRMARHLEQQQQLPTENKPLIAELPKLTPPSLPAEVVPKADPRKAAALAANGGTGTQRVDPRLARRLEQQKAAAAGPSNPSEPPPPPPPPRPAEETATNANKEQAKPKPVAKRDPRQRGRGQPGKLRGNTDGRKNRMDYASPLSTYESEVDRPSGYSSYQRRPQPRPPVLPADASAMPPPPPPPPKPVPPPAMQDLMMSATPTPLGVISDDLLFQADQAMKSLKDVFKTKDPTASPFC